MKYLLYGICQQNAEKFSQEPGIRVVAGHGLEVVASQLDEPVPAPSIPKLLAYEKVVERIHAVRDVIPLRYGCLMESEEQIVRLLDDHRQEYEAMFVHSPAVFHNPRWLAISHPCAAATTSRPHWLQRNPCWLIKSRPSLRAGPPGSEGRPRRPLTGACFRSAF
jgi:hypothetical protein